MTRLLRTLVVLVLPLCHLDAQHLDAQHVDAQRVDAQQGDAQQGDAQQGDARETEADIFHTIAGLDTALFEAYNRCDLEKFSAFLADDLEFYHDATGLSRGAQTTVDAVRKNVCGKVHRELAPGTLAVYPLKNYGAIETGIHFFCNPGTLGAGGKCPEGSGVGRFTHLWQWKDGKWKLTRVLSYDHCNGCSTSQPPDFRVVPAK